jgi:hypothetical protein
MKNPNIQIGEQIRPMTDAEYAQWQADQAEAETKAQTEADKATTKEAVLAKLGLTVDEVTALLS